MEEIKFCPNCSHPNPASNEFCEACGASLNDEVIQAENHPAYNEIHHEDGTSAYYVSTEPPVQIVENPQAFTFSIALRISLFTGWVSLLISLVLLFGSVTYMIALAIYNMLTLFDVILLSIIIGIEVLTLIMFLIVRPYIATKNSQKQRESFHNFRMEIYKDRICWNSEYQTPEGDVQTFRQMILLRDIFSYREYNDIFIFGVSLGQRRTCFAMRKKTLSEDSLAIMRGRIEEINASKRR